MIVEKIDQAKQSKIKLWPVHANRASEAGHECERYLVYNRLNWQEKLLHDLGLQYIFDEGQKQEQVTIDDLRESGFEIIEAQRPFKDEELQLTGHIDFKLSLNGGKLYPVEVKGLSPITWNKINAFSDIFSNKNHYVRKYAAQITLYLYLGNAEEGYFLLRNKLSGRYKEIPVTLDYEYVDTLIEKLKRVNGHVVGKTFPLQIENFTVCQECAFRHICLPDMNYGNSLEVIDNKELEELLNRRAELVGAYKEYNEINDRIKQISNGHEKMIVGDWLITGKYYERANYKIPDEIKKKYLEKMKYWKTNIAKIK